MDNRTPLSITNDYVFVFSYTDSSFVPPLIYAVMGSSRDMAIGPVAVVSLLLATLLRDVRDPVKEKAEYQRLAFTATFFAGITQFTLGFFRYLASMHAKKRQQTHLEKLLPRK